MELRADASRQVDALILVESVVQADPTNPTAPLLFRIARLAVRRDLATMVFARSWIAGTLPSAYADPKLHANIPGSRLIVYPHTGHLVIEEAADRSATDVAHFLDVRGR